MGSIIFIPTRQLDTGGTALSNKTSELKTIREDDEEVRGFHFPASLAIFIKSSRLTVSFSFITVNLAPLFSTLLLSQTLQK